MAILGDYERDDNDLLYEVDETGAQEVVRSLESTHRVYIRFTNVMSRSVNVWWRDFNGIRQLYVCLKPGEFCDINTFATHPWEFTDEATGERYNVGDQPIFRAPKCRGDTQFRSNWNISVALRSLRDTALLHVALAIPRPEDVPALGLPRELAEDVKSLVDVLKCRRQMNQRVD